VNVAAVTIATAVEHIPAVTITTGAVNVAAPVTIATAAVNILFLLLLLLL
jgi:hypothetical protein